MGRTGAVGVNRNIAELVDADRMEGGGHPTDPSYRPYHQIVWCIISTSSIFLYDAGGVGGINPNIRIPYPLLSYGADESQGSGGGAEVEVEEQKSGAGKCPFVAYNAQGHAMSQ